MNAIILTIHIAALSLSIVATLVMTVAALASKATPKKLRQANLLVTGVGIALGGILLIQNPIGSRCLELTAYLAIFAVAYRFISTRSIQLVSARSTSGASID
jgi:hypothetical protein